MVKFLLSNIYHALYYMAHVPLFITILWLVFVKMKTYFVSYYNIILVLPDVAMATQKALFGKFD